MHSFLRRENFSTIERRMLALSGFLSLHTLVYALSIYFFSAMFGQKIVKYT
jgi:hypothetical protein